MSDYMFMLESHLNQRQNRAVTEVRRAAEAAGMQLYLTGGAMRDMVGGFPIRDLDFAVEGDALKLAKTLVKQAEAVLVSEDRARKSAELLFPGGVTAEVAMTRSEQRTRPGAKPQISLGTIREDLLHRDFTINAIGLSLSPASLGLLVDPSNGLADLANRELRAINNYVMYDDPVRILRLVRLRARLDFTLEARTAQQYENVRLEEVEKQIPPRKLFLEFRAIATEPDPRKVIQSLQDEKLIYVFSPKLAAAGNRLAGAAKYQKLIQMLPAGSEHKLNHWVLLLHCLTEDFTPREKEAMAKAMAMEPEEIKAWRNLEARVKKLETAVAGAAYKVPSEAFRRLREVPAEELLLLRMEARNKVTQERVKAYFQKHLPLAQEITERFQAGAPEILAMDRPLEEIIAGRLDGTLRVPKPKIEPPPPPDLTPPGLRRKSIRLS